MKDVDDGEVLRILRKEIDELKTRVEALKLEVARQKRANSRLQTLLDVMRLAS